jgi:hypothetical protein
MITRRSVTLFLTVCFVLFGCQFTLAQENLLQNPDFEDATTAPWSMWVEGQAAGAAAEMIIDNTESVTGNQSLLIDITAEGGDKRVELHQNPFTLDNGQILTYALWAKTEPGKTRSARMICNERAAPWTSYGSTEIEITDQWTEFWVLPEMTVDSVNVGIYVELKDTPAPAKIWFDHFRFYVGEYIAEDLAEPASVEPYEKSTSTWSAIKSAF